MRVFYTHKHLERYKAVTEQLINEKERVEMGLKFFKTVIRLKRFSPQNRLFLVFFIKTL